MNMDAYSKLAAMYQQLHQPPVSGSKNWARLWSIVLVW